MSVASTYQRLSEPWLILSTLHDALCKSLELAIEGAELPDDSRASIDASNKDWNDGYAVIPLHGTMMKEPSTLERLFFDATDTATFTAQVNEAADDDSVRGVLLDIDSGGGSVSGVLEAAKAVRSAKANKPVVSFTDGIMASAAYWVGSQANLMVGSPSARLGSIGVYMPFLDASKEFEQAGLKLDLITNKEGTYKGAGYYGTALTDDQRGQIQAEVQEIFDLFKGEVEASRGSMEPSVMQGQTFLAQGAKKVNLLDVAGDYSDAMALLEAEVNRRESIPNG